MTVQKKLVFETIYNTYSKLIYGIALEISPSEELAEELFIATFKNAFEQKIDEIKYPSICISLIKLIIKTAHEMQNNNHGKPNFKIKQFENTPLLHQLICEQTTLDNHCITHDLQNSVERKKLRTEFSLVRNI